MAGGAICFALLLAANFLVDRYQQYQEQQRRDKLAALEELAMSTLRGDIDSVTRLSDESYRVQIYLENTGGEDKPIYVMRPAVQASCRSGWTGRKFR
jgi:hypothetical protein